MSGTRDGSVSMRYVFDSIRVKPPLVSVIVTNYNYARYLETCLGSIASQSYPHFECVVVDDASTDDSIAVIEGFIKSNQAAGKFRLERHVQNEGQMAAFQSGLDHTHGPFVVFVDADDLLFPDFLETHLKAHLNSARVAAFTNSELVQISENGQVLTGIQGLVGTPEVRATRDTDGHAWSIVPSGDFTLEQAQLPLKFFGPWEIDPTGWIWSTTSAAMFRRAVLDAIMSPEARCLRISADRYMFNFSHGLGGSLLIRSVHGCYRRHGTNGFAANPVLGGESFIGDIRRDPASQANILIFQHVLQHFEFFCSLYGRPYTIRMLRVFGPPRRFDKLKLAVATLYRMKSVGLSLRGRGQLERSRNQLTAAIDSGK
jgi:glycosyltransferase involved in cell wall biosynthesis